MEQKYRTILRLHWSSIRDKLEPKNILQKLVTVLTDTDKAEIKAQSKREERCDKLREILLGKEPTVTACKVFVEALKQTVPELALDLIEADKKTEDELIDPTKQSAKLLTGICNLKTELETEKQNRIKTLQGLKKMKSLRGKRNETIEEEITPDGLQKEETTTESLSKKEQGQKRQKKKIKEEDESLLQKCDHLDEKNKQEKQSENLEAAKEAQEKIRQLQRENTQLKEKVTEEILELEQHFQAQSEVKDVILEKMRSKIKRLHKQSNARRSKCDALSEEVRRLKEILGHESCSRCEGLRNERDSATREKQTLNGKIQDLINNIKKNNEYYQEEKQILQNSLERVESENKNLQHRLSESLEAATEKDQEQMIRQLTTENEELKQEVTKKKSKINKMARAQKKKNKKLKAKDVELQKMREENKRLHEEINAEKPKCDDDLREEVGKLCQMPCPGRVHNYEKDFDSNGIVYALVRNSGSSNSTQTSILTATRSSDGEGKAIDILENRVDREIVSGTKAEEKSWWCVDLTENNALYLTHYTLRHGHHTFNSFLLNWQLEGSLDGESWKTLSRHDSDRSLKGNKRYKTHTWAIDGDYSAFRYFRILQTGKNSTGNLGIFLSGIELYGVLIEKGS